MPEHGFRSWFSVRFSYEQRENYFAPNRENEVAPWHGTDYRQKSWTIISIEWEKGSCCCNPVWEYPTDEDGYAGSIPGYAEKRPVPAQNLGTSDDYGSMGTLGTQLQKAIYRSLFSISGTKDTGYCFSIYSINYIVSYPSYPRGLFPRIYRGSPWVRLPGTMSFRAYPSYPD